MLVLASIALVGLIRDYRTRKRRLQEQVAARTADLTQALEAASRQAELLRESEEAKTRFFANVAHAFRTPLTLALGPLEDIRRGVYGPISGEMDAELDVALRNSRRLGRLVDDLLRISRLGAGALKLMVQPLNLSDIVRKLHQEFGPLAERKGITLLHDSPEWLTVWGDEQQIVEAFGNLISNALKYTDAGGTVTVTVTPENDAGRITVTVRDTGRGIPPEDLPHLFDRFFRVHHGADDAEPGSGIGLSSARDVLRLHGGSIEAASTLGQGSTFTVRLRTGTDHFDPEVADWLEQGPDEPLHDPASDVQAARDSGTEAGPDGAGSDRATVLIVEDNHDMRKYIRRRLSGLYRIAEAPDGQTGLDKAKRLLPDLILADVMMPGMDGWTLCRDIKSHPDLQFVPVILLTARASREDRIKGLETDADAYLTKPFEVAELQATIANLLRKNELVKVKLAEMSSDVESTLRTVTDRKGGFSFEESVRSVILRHIDNADFTVEELARHMSLSRAHLYRLLMEQKGIGPSEFLFVVRLEKAAELLIHTDLSVKDVAAATGFKTVPHFSRRFRDHFGRTASDYRASARTTT